MLVPVRREKALLWHQFTAWKKFPGQGEGGRIPNRAWGLRLRLRRIELMRKSTGEERAAHKEVLDSVQGSLKLQLNINLHIIEVKHHKVREKTARKQKTEQFPALMETWE